MKLQILDTDRFFYDSPNAGEKDCICSRCQQHIDEGQVPLRVAVDQEVLYHTTTSGGNKGVMVANGLEFRLCDSCQVKIGIVDAGK